jgi:hypothetical protein
MKKSIVITIMILLILLGIFIIASGAITKYTGYVTGHTLKESQSQENCNIVKENSNLNKCKGG